MNATAACRPRTPHAVRFALAFAALALTLAAALAVLAGPALAAPGHAATGAQNCARASLPAAPDRARAIAAESPCTRPGSVAAPAKSAVGCCVAAKGERGGLNLYKWKDPTSTTASGWREGDRMLIVPWKGTPKATWKENASRLRREMRSGDPIYETYVDDAGNLLPAGGPGNPGQFLRAERNLLTNHGWTYHPRTRAWVPPSP